MEQNYDGLKLENQMCFPLYAASREVIKRYRPHLEKLDLTYTQYIAMMVFWQEKKLSVKELGKKLFLDSGTLTPVLKSLEAKGYISMGDNSNRTIRLVGAEFGRTSQIPLLGTVTAGQPILAFEEVRCMSVDIGVV